MDAARNPSTFRRLLPLVGVVVGVLGIGFVVRIVVVRRDEVGDAFSGVDLVPLAASLVLGLAAMTLIGSLWTSMLRARGHEAPRNRAMSWYFVGQLGKYVPGGIWPIVGRAELAVRGGVPRGPAYAATGSSLLATYAAAPVAAAAGALLDGRHAVTGAVIVVAYVLLWADMGSAGFVRGLADVITRVTGREVPVPPRAEFFRTVARHVPAWVLMSLSTSVTAHAFGADIGAAEMLYVTSISWLAGFVVPGVPGGIGVREAVFTALAGPTTGTAVAVSLALASRVVFMAVDITGAALSSMVAGRVRRTSAER
ncbi:MAG: lysylphosphatidylglycerol synthase domain-containing protein [Acidimicrobiales bacterium]